MMKHFIIFFTLCILTRHTKYEYNHYDKQSIIELSFINKDNIPTEDSELFKKVYGL